MSLRARTARGFKWQLINILGRQVLSFAIFTTLARLLEPSTFGMVGLIYVYLSFIALFAEQGIATALIQRQSLEADHLSTAFWFNLGCATLLCVGTMVAAGPIASAMGEPDLATLLRWSSISLVLSAASTIHVTLFVKELDFRRPAIRALLATGVGGTVGVGMALAGYGAAALVGQQLATAAAGTGFLWSTSTYRPSLRFSPRHLRDLLYVSSSVFGTSVLWFVSTRLDQIAIGRFLGPSALGFYVVAGKLPEVARLAISRPIDEVVTPLLAGLQSDRERICKAIYKGMELNALISMAVFGGIALTADELVPVLFGAKWAPSAPAAALLSLYVLCNALQVFFHPALIASGGVGRYVLLNVGHACGVCVVCFLGIRFGVNYLVAGLIANSVVMAVPSLLFLRRRIGLSILAYLTPCLAPLVAAVAMGGAILLIDHLFQFEVPGWLSLSSKVLVGAVAYIAVLFAIAPTGCRALLETVEQAAGRRKSIPIAS